MNKVPKHKSIYCSSCSKHTFSFIAKSNVHLGFDISLLKDKWIIDYRMIVISIAHLLNLLLKMTRVLIVSFTLVTSVMDTSMYVSKFVAVCQYTCVFFGTWLEFC